MELRHILKKCLKERSLSIKKLAEMSGVKVSTLQDWVAGTKPRDLDAVRKVSQALGVSFEYLIFGTEAEVPVSIQNILDSLPTQVLHQGWVKLTIELPANQKIKKGPTS